MEWLEISSNFCSKIKGGDYLKNKIILSSGCVWKKITLIIFFKFFYFILNFNVRIDFLECKNMY